MKFKKIEDYLNLKEELRSKKISIRNHVENSILGSVIYGAGYSEKIAELMSSFDNNNISYFIDDDLNKVGKSINNIKVISFKDFQEISKISSIRNVIFAIPSLNSKG